MTSTSSRIFRSNFPTINVSYVKEYIVKTTLHCWKNLVRGNVEYLPSGNIVAVDDSSQSNNE